MSLYPQNLYGQMPFPGPSYSQVGYQYQQLPPPPPVYHVDPASFRRDYTSRLAELTVNSRPIIQNLSMIAQEYSRWAEIVAQCLEAHIRRVSRSIFSTFFLMVALGCRVIRGILFLYTLSLPVFSLSS
jgi:pre-mRNA cleavage complex 2 protein Pcf11